MGLVRIEVRLFRVILTMQDASNTQLSPQPLGAIKQETNVLWKNCSSFLLRSGPSSQGIRIMI